ncbi:MAG: hypothetical protein NVSMB2_12600 [Chloroflexota bacterium]
MSINIEVGRQDHLHSGYGYGRSRTIPTATPHDEASDGQPARQSVAVTISLAGRALAAERARTERADGTREDRINAIKAAVTSGTYDVSSHALATTLVKNFAQ